MLLWFILQELLKPYIGQSNKIILEKYIQILKEGYINYASYFYNEVIHPHWGNYFYWVVICALLIWILEINFPWRKNQDAIREGFWIDLFYIFWNYFLFSLVAYNAWSNLFVNLFHDFLGVFGVKNLVAIELGSFNKWIQLLIIFILKDFIQYNIHKLLHNVNWMWSFHKVHHSTEQMGFGALMRYHFMENVIYRSLEYIPLAMLGFGIKDFFVVHMFTFILGLLGHSNLFIPLGRMKYILNNPQMHLWHHAKEFPESHPHGFNYGISLSIWDYIFKTNYQPYDDPDLKVGLPEKDKLPNNFIGQQLSGFNKLKS
jgi:sterol desaturase/sphingolipid hydroxylase (fatty acid hydroxylase superfamily)